MFKIRTTWATDQSKGGLRRRRACPRVVAPALVVAILSLAATADAVARSVYAGEVGSNATTGMTIMLQLVRGGRSAKWDLSVDGPCNEPDIRFGYGIESGQGGTPLLDIRDGRFSITKHGRMGHSAHIYAYRLTGHAVPGGFVGTFHWFDQLESIRCNSKLFHWHASPTRKPFE